MTKIDRQAVLRVIDAFVAEHFPNFPRHNLEEATAAQVITQSLELVEFVLELEEKLGIEININKLGEHLITHTFGRLADDLAASKVS